jgi:hypothetical protein
MDHIEFGIIAGVLSLHEICKELRIMNCGSQREKDAMRENMENAAKTGLVIGAIIGVISFAIPAAQAYIKNKT